MRLPHGKFRLSENAKSALPNLTPEFDVIARLSAKENELFALLGTGLTCPEVAEKRGVSIKTIESQFKSIKEKFGMMRGPLIRLAIRYAMFQELSGLTPSVKETKQIVFA